MKFSSSESKGHLLHFNLERTIGECIQRSARYAYMLLSRNLTRWQGPRFLQRYSSEVDLSTRLLYFSLTTFMGDLILQKESRVDRKTGSQTLGEEYTDILQVSRKTRRVPTRVVSPFIVIFKTDNQRSVDCGFSDYTLLLLMLSWLFIPASKLVYSNSKKSNALIQKINQAGKFNWHR